MKSISPYLNFNGNTEEAFNFYKSVFGGEFLGVTRFKDFGESGMGGMNSMPEEDLSKIANMGLPLANGAILMGTDFLESWGRSLTIGNNVYIMIEAESGEEADRLFDALAAGGETEMPLDKTEWAEKYGSCVDKFGVRWMVNYTGSVEFSGGQAG